MISITRLPLKAKGDVLTRNASRVVRLPVGTNGKALVADSTAATGLKWATVGGGGLTAELSGAVNYAVGAELELFCSAISETSLTYVWQRGSTVVGTNSPTLLITSAALGDSGDYRCAVSNSAGTVFSDPLTVTVLTPPAIVSETPPDPTPTVNSFVNFALSATGSALAYQWQKLVGAVWADLTNAGTLSGALTNTLTMQATEAHQGSYRCRVWNAVGEVFSTAMPIAMTPPVIVTQPSPIGTDGTAAVVATGVGTLVYQWEFGGVAITGQTTATLTVSDCLGALDLTRGHRFRCRVSNAFGYVLSEEVGCRPFLHGTTSTAQGLTRAQPEAVVLLAGLVAPPGALYTWTRNGTAIGSELDLFGDSVPRLTLRNVQTADAGTYVCTASNVFGSTASAGIEVTVAANDAVHSHPGTRVNVFSDQSFSVAVEALLPGIPASEGAGYYQLDRAWLPTVGGARVWASQQAHVTYLGPTHYTPDTGAGVAAPWATGSLALNGATLAPLTQWDFSYSSQVASNAGDVVTQPFAAASGIGATPLTTLESRVITRAAITALTASQTLILGDALALTVTATGDDLEFAWYRNHAGTVTRLPDFATATLNIANVGPDDAGLYLVKVGNRSFNATEIVAAERLVNVIGILSTPANGPRAAGAVITADSCGTSVQFALYLDGSQVGAWQGSPAFTVGTHYGTWVLKVRHTVATDKLHASGEFTVTAP